MELVKTASKRHNTQHYSAQHNDTLHKGHVYDNQHKNALPYAECLYAECAFYLLLCCMSLC